MKDNYFSELEKIANEIAVDQDDEPMVEDSSPSVTEDEVEAAQAANAPEPDAAEEQLPMSPEDEEALSQSIEEAYSNLQAAEEQLAHSLERYEEFEKTAGQALSDSLPAMGAFAKLIDYSTNPDSDPQLHKIAQERLQTALTSDEQFINVLHKTAQELFEDEQNLRDLYTPEGMEYISEQLAHFENDDELTKIAFEPGAVVGKVVDTIKDYGSAAKNFFKMKDELQSAGQALEQARADVETYGDIASKLTAQGSPKAEKADLDYILATQKELQSERAYNDLADQRRKGGIVLGAGGAGLAGGAAYGGKKIYDSFHPNEIEEEQFEGGNVKMANQIVNDFLKVAGAATLIDIANNEGLHEDLRKEATEQFNYISRLGRRDMDEAFVKVATNLYTEDQLHEIVAGHHTEELIDKVAFFLDANEASADELEKIAGADGVAAKGVAGALTDAAKNIEEHIKEEKEKSSTQANGRRNVNDPGDTSGYNVVNNPAKYDVEKTAMIEQAVMQKQAAIQAYAEAEEFLKSF